MFDSIGFAVRLKQLRGEMSQEQLSAELNVTQGYIGHLETARRKPYIDFIILLSQKFGKSLDLLLTGKEFKIVNIHDHQKIALSEFCHELSKIEQSVPELRKENQNEGYG